YALTSTSPYKNAGTDQRDIGADFEILRLATSGAISGNWTPNPIDNSRYFVRQHYVDFLNREPDGGGLNFWTNDIEQCGADAACREAHRINVSAAFFLSIEFQQTGYLVYKMYKAGFGNVPGTPVAVRLANFMPDTHSIGAGVVVGQGDWQTQLENNKQAFALAFVQRPAFQAAHGSQDA